jgi:NhaP-type Na+/H+ and K+/H+ antiporter
MSFSEILWVVMILTAMVSVRFGLPLLLTWLVGGAVDHAIHPRGDSLQ